MPPRAAVNAPRGWRKDARTTVVLSVLILGLGAWNLWEGHTFTGLGCVWAASVFVWLVYRDYRIAQEPSRLPARDADGGDIASTED